MFKKILIHARKGIKFTILFMIAAFLIVGAIAFLYKPTYSVFIMENRLDIQKTVRITAQNK